MKRRWKLAAALLVVAVAAVEVVLVATGSRTRGGSPKRTTVPQQATMESASRSRLVADDVVVVRGPEGIRVRVAAEVDGRQSVPTIARSTTIPASGTARLRLTDAGRAALNDCDLNALVVHTSGSGTSAEAKVVPIDDQTAPCGRFFPRSDVWSTPLPKEAGVDPHSAQVVADLKRQVDENVSAHFGPDINARDFSTRVYTVPDDQPVVDVAVPPEKRALHAPFARAPLPPDARPAEGTDHHLVLYQPSTDKMWEFFGLQRTGSDWSTEWGGYLDHVSKSDGIFHAAADGIKYGATATGLALAGGLISAGDLRRGRIDHALAIAVPQARSGEWSLPAQRTDGVSSRRNAVPEGARFRLDPSFDVSTLQASPLVRMLAQAAQDYGLIVRDQSGVVAFYAQARNNGDNGPFDRLRGREAPVLLQHFPWGRLQLTPMRITTG